MYHIKINKNHNNLEPLKNFSIVTSMKITCMLKGANQCIGSGTFKHWCKDNLIRQ